MIRAPLLALLTALAAAPLSAAAAPPTAAERTMTATVDAEQPRTVALLERLVNQNSGTQNLSGVRATCELIRPEFEALGFKVRWVQQDAVARAGHLVATHAGRKGAKRILLIGHLDTVFEPDSPFQKFERVDETHAKGPGVSDDKGGDVVMIAALRAMQAAGTLKKANIEVILTGDEEEAGLPISASRADLVAAGRRADVALDFEGLAREDGRDMGSVARRSAGNWTLTVTARSGHSSGVFSQFAGDGAIYELARILAAYRQELPQPNLTYNVGLVAGGATAALAPDGAHAEATGKTNIIPAQAIARGDLRALSGTQIAATVARMQAIAATSLNGTKAVFEFEDKYPPMAPTAGNRALLARLNGVNATLGLAAMGELDPLKRGAGDISFVAADVDSLAGLGPVSEGDHTPGETVDIPSIFTQAKRAALLMSRLAAEKP
ncbi:M20/M25/M40 family metallo-hydrolase [Novosphingobium tardum]|uniref:M20/M25/M40 family metallo-hydrolase n=1 Tax=Novosphingobium tardum TaxID=1538021 RepID=A0ABV8RLR2_9SPHN